MSNKQSEMSCEKCLHYFACRVNSEYVPTPCCAYEDKAGYRKQSVGEWMKDEQSIFEHRYHCSVCNFYLIGVPTNHCPNCGAKMKGE